MARGIGEHRVAHLSRTALASRPAHGRGPRLSESCQQRVARARELSDPRNARLAGARGSSARWSELAAVGGQLRLEPADLAAQLAPRGALVGL